MSALSKGEETFAWQCRVLGLEPLGEFRFDAKRGFGWDANPWVFVISFRRVER